jgi:uncharacterized membrane protein
MNPLGTAHLTAACIALLLGFLVLLAPKGDQLHRLFGAGYVTAMILVNLTALGLYGLTGNVGPFHALAITSLAVTVWGVLPAVRRPAGWLARHFYAMAYSYIGLLAATCAEAMVRIKPLRPLFDSPGRTIAAGVAIAFAFTAAGTLLLPRLEHKAMAALPERNS